MSSTSIAVPRATRADLAVRAFFAGCILGIPVSAWLGRLDVALGLAFVVLVEVGILLLNGMTCGLTPLAARYTPDRAPNFDIFLPRWLALHNKAIFGSLYVTGLAFALFGWITSHE